MLEDDRRAFFLRNGNGFYELLLETLADFLSCLLLQDDEVTAYVRSSLSENIPDGRRSAEIRRLFCMR